MLNNNTKKLNDDRVRSYACKFLEDYSRNTVVNNAVLEKAFQHCVIPADKSLYEPIKQRIEEMREDCRFKFQDDEH